MKAGDWKCPRCGEGFRDVAPDYEIGPDGPDRMAGYELLAGSTGAVHGHCGNDHGYFLGWRLELDGSVSYRNDATCVCGCGMPVEAANG